MAIWTLLRLADQQSLWNYGFGKVIMWIRSPWQNFVPYAPIAKRSPSTLRSIQSACHTLYTIRSNRNGGMRYKCHPHQPGP